MILGDKLGFYFWLFIQSDGTHYELTRRPDAKVIRRKGAHEGVLQEMGSAAKGNAVVYESKKGSVPSS